MRLIDADALKEVLLNPVTNDLSKITWGDIDNAPTVDVVRHGHWILDGKRMVIVLKYKCSKCGNRSAKKDNYCSHCGSKMDEPTESNTVD